MAGVFGSPLYGSSSVTWNTLWMRMVGGSSSRLAWDPIFFRTLNGLSLLSSSLLQGL